MPAQKSILILDTCESATAVRGNDVERETAIDRLQRATGRSVIAAGSSAAYEGYEGHGLLTFAILDAFRRLDKGDSEVDLLTLARHIDVRVPELSRRVFGVTQTPHHKIEGNFPIGVRLANIGPIATGEAIPKTATHVVIKSERVREKPAAEALGELVLAPGMQVRVLEFAGAWAQVARDGQKLGYVPADVLAKLQ
jgi:hypothetical protein